MLRDQINAIHQKGRVAWVDVKENGEFALHHAPHGGRSRGTSRARRSSERPERRRVTDRSARCFPENLFHTGLRRALAGAAPEVQTHPRSRPPPAAPRSASAEDLAFLLQSRRRALVAVMGPVGRSAAHWQVDVSSEGRMERRWRRRADSNRRITVLQTVALTTWLRRLLAHLRVLGLTHSTLCARLCARRVDSGHRRRRRNRLTEPLEPLTAPRR